MGAYLSEPVTEKISNDETSEKLEYGASSMQGWRVNQEDAHNTILEFDTNTSLFAVYDGHGGAEVATYCSQKLPQYIKDTDAYKKGNLSQALEDAFLGFDATIATKEVMDVLKELAGEINPPGPSDNEESDEDENVSNLYKEAGLPLQEVLAKYDNKLGVLHRARIGDNEVPLSPCLRARKNEDRNAGASSSSALGFAAGSSSEQTNTATSSIDGPSTSSNEDGRDFNADDTGGVSSTNCNDDDRDLNGEVSTSNTSQNKQETSMEIDKLNSTAPDSSGDNCQNTPEQSENVMHNLRIPENGTEVCNGEISETKEKEPAEENITSTNGSTTTPIKSGLPVSSSEVCVPERPKKVQLRRAAAAMYKSLLLHNDDEEDEDDSDNDETFEGGEVNSSDEENINGVSDSSNDGEEEDENEECEEEGEGESSDEDYEEDLTMTEEPGSDSGCTAVVALLKGNELYVANAGDSRCVICRNGTAIDMSIDHKPEDPPELERITKAGGKVSNDGRINGGLNLSRAIGDHSYKQNKDLDAKKQMITALPDIKTLTIDPKTDQFMVLACDGIWNYMSSQDVCDFILPKLTEGRQRLSQICEEMFDHCLAPSTMGDGTGCDNMTAIIVCFKDGLVSDVGQYASIAAESSNKRVAEEDPTEDLQDTKRQKVDDSLSSSVVTSSV
ncbi:Probable protein phosphatase CG10417 [Eumeta japonica]|uniref:protein-serine/threonine phosphatase n=1 Tax=Eumeta variegata TaxID=151549 RepID=A0A4C1UFM1_EUMVA|nr:Probable protein phosphatase CG10417 [Eumeta japonica]